MDQSRTCAVLVFAAIITMATTSQAQTKATLSGTVVDNSGAFVSGVHVEAKLICKCSDCPGEACKCCPGAVSATSNESGNFQLSELVPGKYKVTVSGKHIHTTTREAETTAGGSQKLKIIVKAKAGGAEY